MWLDVFINNCVPGPIVAIKPVFGVPDKVTFKPAQLQRLARKLKFRS